MGVLQLSVTPADLILMRLNRTVVKAAVPMSIMVHALPVTQPSPAGVRKSRARLGD